MSELLKMANGLIAPSLSLDLMLQDRLEVEHEATIKAQYLTPSKPAD